MAVALDPLTNYRRASSRLYGHARFAFQHFLRKLHPSDGAGTLGRGRASARIPSRRRTRTWSGAPGLAGNTPVSRLLPASERESARPKRMVEQRDDVG
jgi:hypothetical protein